MKVVLPSNAHRVSYQHSTVLSLVPEKITLTKENSITLKLRSIPTDANSTKYEYVARILNGTEGCRPALQFSKDLDAIWAGLFNRTTKMRTGNEYPMNTKSMTLLQSQLISHTSH